MSRRNLFCGLAAAIATVIFVSQAMAQGGPTPAPPGPGGPGGAVIVIPEGGEGGGEHRQFDPEQMKKRFEEMRKQMSDDMRKQMGANDDEWKVLEPKITKVVELTAQANFGGMRLRFRPPGAPADENAKPSAVETARKDLQKVLDNKDAKPDEVKKALTTYRGARDKAKLDAKAQLEKAQKDLRDVLTQRQEAYLVLRQVLE